MWIGHRKEIRNLTFRALALHLSEPSLSYTWRLLRLNSDDSIIEWGSCTRDVWRARKKRESCSRRRRRQARLSESPYAIQRTSYSWSPKHLLLPITKSFTCLWRWCWVFYRKFYKYLRIQVFLSVDNFIPAGHAHLTLEGLYKHRWLQPPLLLWQLEPTSRRSELIKQELLFILLEDLALIN